MKTWFRIENSLIDRDDLSAYEKLCCIVIARYAGRPEFNHLITVKTIAKKMGVEESTAATSLERLLEKGLITEEFSSSIDLEKNVDSTEITGNIESAENLTNKENITNTGNLGSVKTVYVAQKSEKEEIIETSSNLIKMTDDINAEPMQMPSWDNEDDAENMLMQVMEFIEEPINARQGRIILGLANNNIEKVKSCYNASRTMFGNARIDALIECLQIKDIESDKDDIGIDIRGRIGGQVNRFRLEQMKKYNKFSKKTKK